MVDTSSDGRGALLFFSTCRPGALSSFIAVETKTWLCEEFREAMEKRSELVSEWFLDCYGEELSLEVTFMVHQWISPSYPHPWFWALNEIPVTRCPDQFPWAQTCGFLSFHSSFASKTPFCKGILGTLTGTRTKSKPRACWRKNMSDLSLGILKISLGNPASLSLLPHLRPG